MNWLLVFIPVTLALERIGASEPWIFFAAALAIVPIAALIVRSTEQLATYTGDTIGGLLNASFGNAPELIVAIVALRSGLLDMVRASLAGAILLNLLLALGLAFLAGGLRHHTQTYNVAAARVYGSLMLIAALSLMVPSAFSRVLAPDAPVHAETLLNIGLAFVLLTAYALYLLFQLKTHPHEFAGKPGAVSDRKGQEQQAHGPRWSLPRAVLSLLGASVFAALKNKMDLSLSIALGAAIQIALFVAPVLVLASYFVAPEPLQLSFSRLEVGAVFMAALIAVYLIIALMFYFIPTGE